MLPPVRCTTKTVFTPGQFFSAVSVLAFSGILRPPRRPSSAVMTQLDSQSWMRPARASGEKPPNTPEWMAPVRAQARMAEAATNGRSEGRARGSPDVEKLVGDVT